MFDSGVILFGEIRFQSLLGSNVQEKATKLVEQELFTIKNKAKIKMQQHFAECLLS